MIALGELSPAAAEVQFRLLDVTNPIFNQITGHDFSNNQSTGEVRMQLPGGVWFNPVGSQIVEKGHGWYAVQLSSSQTTTAGLIALHVVVTGAQPIFDVEEIDISGGDFANNETTAQIPFFLPNATDPINGAPITGHVFVAGEVQICFPGSVFANANLANIVELGYGGYALKLSQSQTLARGKIYLYVNIGSSSEPAGVVATCLSATASAAAAASGTVVTAVSTAGYPAQIDHIAAGVRRLPSQFAIKTKIVALLKAMLGPCNDIETALQALLIQRTIDTAVGAQLDIIGRIVGQPRLGLSDTDYRRYCKVKIKAENSGGVIEDLISVCVLILDVSLVAPLTVTTQQPATVVIQHFAGALNDTLAATCYSFLRTAGAGGVRVIFEWIDVPIAQVYRLDAGPGLDVGHLAGSLG